MARNRIIFYGIFAAYQLMAFIFTVVIDSTQSTSFLLGLLKYIGWFKYITFIGFALIVTDFIWMWTDHRRFRKSEEAARHENNILKAKVYDMQEGNKPKPKEELPKTK